MRRMGMLMRTLASSENPPPWSHASKYSMVVGLITLRDDMDTIMAASNWPLRSA